MDQFCSCILGMVASALRSEQIVGNVESHDLVVNGVSHASSASLFPARATSSDMSNPTLLAILIAAVFVAFLMQFRSSPDLSFATARKSTDNNDFDSGLRFASVVSPVRTPRVLLRAGIMLRVLLWGGRRPFSADAAPPARAFIEDTISRNKVVVFSKTTCGYCARAKSMLGQLNIPYTAVELNQHANGNEIQDTLFEMTTQSTVPNIFIAGQSIGGSSDLLEAYSNGELALQLAKADIYIK